MPRPVRNQVVVITGASSGIGRETAVMLGERGASVVLAARNEAALPHLTRQGQGTIINVASALAERGAPLQAAYCATKHGIKGFTESLRLELARDHPGITVTLIEPSSINTPLFRHARSKLGVLPQPIPPVYEPRVVAETILFAAEHPRWTIVAGGSGKLLVQAEKLSPSLVDWYMLQQERGFRQQQTDRPDDGQDNLFAPMGGTGSVTGEFGQRSKSTSLYTRHLELHPNRQRALNAAVLVGLVALVRRIGR